MVQKVGLICFSFLILPCFVNSENQERILTIDTIFGDLNSYKNSEVIFKGYYAEGTFFANDEFSWSFKENYIVMPYRGAKTDEFVEKCTGKLLVARGKLYVDNIRAPRIREIDTLYPLVDPKINCLSLIEHFDN